MSPGFAWLRRTQRRMPHRRDDSGVAMIYAMVFITVVAVAVAAVLGLAEANIRATERLRIQAAQGAAADGAAQVAINELRRGNFVGPSGDCFASGTTLQVPNVTQVQGGGTISATVQCARDDDTSVIPSDPTFDFGLLTLPESGEDGITISVNGSGASFYVDGNISSTGRVHADHGAIRVSRTGSTFAAASCQIDNNGSIWNGTTQILQTSGPCNNSAGAAPDPNIALPADAVPGAAGTVVRSACGSGANAATCGNAQPCAGGSCLNSYCNNNPAKFTFTPGVYSDITVLSTPYGCGSGQTYEFKPGIYFFNFNDAGVSSNNVWQITRGTTVAGFDGTLNSPVSPFPDKCDSPFQANPDGGALFVFGGRSQLRLSGDARLEICARNTVGTSTPPIAFYGLKTAIGSVAAQTGCVTTVGGCPVLQVSRSGGGDPQLVVKGLTYLPRGWIDLDVSGSSRGTFTGGIVARRFVYGAPASTTLPAPFAASPPLTGASRTMLYLTVYICQDAATCSTGTGALRLKVKVALGPQTSPGDRDVTIYSWSVV
jgi:hypothetical protein